MTSRCASTLPVTVSIVLHSQWSLARVLLDELQQHCAGLIDRVVLTVNVPESGVQTEGWAFPVVRIDNPQPKGFGANHNAAFQHCSSPWFLVLNPDIRLGGDVLSRMLNGALATSGVLAPRVQEPGKPEPEPLRGFLTPLELLQRRQPTHRPPQEPAWVAGMFMLLRREAYDEVGGFDERFFMYCEDFDICARLRLAGWQLQVVETVVVAHHARRASRRALRPLAWHLVSLLRVWTSGAFWQYLRLLAPRAGASRG